MLTTVPSRRCNTLLTGRKALNPREDIVDALTGTSPTSSLPRDSLSQHLRQHSHTLAMPRSFQPQFHEQGRLPTSPPSTCGTASSTASFSSNRSRQEEANQKYLLSFADHENPTSSWSAKAWEAREIDSAIMRSGCYARKIFDESNEREVKFVASGTNMTCHITYQSSEAEQVKPKVRVRALIKPNES